MSRRTGTAIALPVRGGIDVNQHGDDEVLEDKRSYYRIPALLPVQLRVIHPSEIAGLESQILGRERFDVTKMDPGLRMWLTRIEEKLEKILVHFESEEDQWITSHEPSHVTISGSGMRVPVTMEVPAGSDVLLHVTLPLNPKLVVRAIGRVSDCIVNPKSIELALSYRVVSEADRDSIVSYVLEVQRNELRLRNENRQIEEE